jgi:TRAP-type C4-dicarboxylate transport system permease small subunit
MPPFVASFEHCSYAGFDTATGYAHTVFMHIFTYALCFYLVLQVVLACWQVAQRNAQRHSAGGLGAYLFNSPLRTHACMTVSHMSKIAFGKTQHVGKHGV